MINSIFKPLILAPNQKQPQTSYCLTETHLLFLSYIWYQPCPSIYGDGRKWAKPPHSQLPAAVTQWAPGKCISKQPACLVGRQKSKRHTRYTSSSEESHIVIPLIHQETSNATFTSFSREDALGMNHATRHSFPQRLNKGNPLLRVAKNQSTEGEQEEQETRRAELQPLRKDSTRTTIQLHIT